LGHSTLAVTKKYTHVTSRLAQDQWPFLVDGMPGQVVIEA
jgi:hypothetical protein